MAYAVTVMTNRDKIANQAIFPVPINMVDNKYAFILKITVITFFIENFPGVLSVATRHLANERFIIPIGQATRLTAICPTTRFFEDIRDHIKHFITRQTRAFNFISSRFGITSSGTKTLWLSGMFFRNKLFITIKTAISDNRFLSKNTTTFMATGGMARIMRFAYTKFCKTNWTGFDYFIHGSILS